MRFNALCQAYERTLNRYKSIHLNIEHIKINLWLIVLQFLGSNDATLAADQPPE